MPKPVHSVMKILCGFYDKVFVSIKTLITFFDKNFVLSDG